MTFSTYMARNYGKEDSPKGDLARAIRADRKRFPMNTNSRIRGWDKVMQEHMLDYGYSAREIETFDACWPEYVEYVRGKRNIRRGAAWN